MEKGKSLTFQQVRRKLKACICPFTCATTRAVQIKPVPDLSADVLLQPFVSRKSLSRAMMSNNATFFAASIKLQIMFNSTALCQELDYRGTYLKSIINEHDFSLAQGGLSKTTLKSCSRPF